MRSLFFVARLLLFAALCSCWRPWSPMVAAPEGNLNEPPPAGRARVVFLRVREASVRHSQQHNPTPVHLIDESGRLLGDLAPDTWVPTELAPGFHEIFACPEHPHPSPRCRS